MKIEDQVVSLELAKRLKDLGVKQESYFYWLNPFKSQEFEIVSHYEWARNNHHEFYSAFTVAELGEMLPHHNIKMYNIQPLIQLRIGGKELNAFVEAKTEADARAKCLIYLIENNMKNTCIKHGEFLCQECEEKEVKRAAIVYFVVIVLMIAVALVLRVLWVK